MEFESYIYKIECKANKKVYIGKTFNPERRWKLHINSLRRGKHPIEDLQRDYERYGESAFAFSLICRSAHTCIDGIRNIDSIEEKRQMEHYKSYLRECGYNYRDPYFYPNNTKRKAPDFGSVEEENETIYDNVKRAADRRGLTISELEKKAGLKNGTISKWKEHSPTVNNIKRVSAVLRISVSTLIKTEKGGI